MKLKNFTVHTVHAHTIPVSTLMDNFLNHAEQPTFQITDHAFLLLDQDPVITEKIHTMIALMEMLDPKTLEEALCHAQKCLEGERFSDDAPSEDDEDMDWDAIFADYLADLFHKACGKAGICDQDLVMVAVDGALLIVPETAETEGEIPPGILRLLNKHKIRPSAFAKVMEEILEGAQDE